MLGSSPISARSSSAPTTGDDRQRIDAQLPVTGLAAPAVAIFRTVVHGQHHGGGRHRVDEIVEEGLSLRIDPVQVLEHEE